MFNVTNINFIIVYTIGMNSKIEIVKMLDDDETGLYGESALYLLSLYEERIIK